MKVIFGHMEECIEVKNAIFVFSRGHFPDFTAKILHFYAHKIVNIYLNGGKSISFSSNQTYTPMNVISGDMEECIEVENANFVFF